MNRTRLFCASALLGAGLFAPVHAAAAAPTCQGQPATVVGVAGGFVDGTGGRDVVVTNGALYVHTLGGDDLVCVTGDRADPAAAAVASVGLDAGPGNDVVEAEVPGWRVTGALGTGADRFTSGTDAGHYVDTGNRDNNDTELDVVRTGAGMDAVSTGAFGEPNGDVVDLGAGDDHVEWRGIATSESLQLGDGRDRLALYGSVGDVVIDVGAERVTTDGVLTVAARGVEDYDFGARRDVPGSLVFLGTDAADVLYVSAPGTFRQRVRLRGGDDSYETLGVTTPGVTRGRISAGPGRDSARLPLQRAHQADLDLDAGVVAVTYKGDTTRARWRGFEDVAVAARRVDVSGTPGDNRVEVKACASTVRTGPGDDEVLASFEGSESTWMQRCGAGVLDGTRVTTGPGEDLVTGTPRNDVLHGGSGQDVIDGRAGRDTCRGETTTSCERR